MRNLRTPILAVLLTSSLLLAACASGSIDDGGGPGAILEVTTTTVPTANLSGSVGDGTCTLTVANASSTLANKAKSAGTPATSPFNDVVVQSVTISYRWDDPLLVTSPRTFDLGATVPTGGTASVQYPPIALGDVDASMLGHTASLQMTFLGRTVSGEFVTADGGGTLSVGGACEP